MPDGHMFDPEKFGEMLAHVEHTREQVDRLVSGMNNVKKEIAHQAVQIGRLEVKVRAIWKVLTGAVLAAVGALIRSLLH